MEKIEKIAVVVDSYYPEINSCSIQMEDLCTYLANSGYNISIITPSSNNNKILNYENKNNIEIFRIKYLNIKNKNNCIRLLLELILPYWMYIVYFIFIRKKKFDAIIWYSPTIFFGPFIKKIKKINKCKSYLILRDIFPLWARDLGLIKSKFLYKILNKIAIAQYSQANIIGIQSPGNLQFFFGSIVKKIDILQNWLTKKESISTNFNLLKSNLDGKKIFVYCGTIGRAQQFNDLLPIFEHYKYNSDVGFLIIGKADNKSRAMLNAFKNYKNIIIHDEIPNRELLGVLEKCHIGLISLNEKHTTHNIPGKFLQYISLGMPVVGIVNKGNDIIDLVDNWEIGYINDNSNIIQIILESEKILMNLEKNIYKYKCELIMNNIFSTQKAANQIISKLEEL